MSFFSYITILILFNISLIQNLYIIKKINYNIKMSNSEYIDIEKLRYEIREVGKTIAR